MHFEYFLLPLSQLELKILGQDICYSFDFAVGLEQLIKLYFFEILITYEWHV